ncbi:hypothetical protein [Vibrio atypicus]|uniref:hypothetical protein n=1 Tax=Vibrio atypicus TaxID=558271 RepID=UPI003735872E
MDLVNKLPYKLPSNEADAVRSLAKVLNVPLHLIQGDTVKISQAMSGTIMYRQLDRLEKQQVMMAIHALGNGLLKSNLIARCTDVLVNPQWGEWSLTNEELTAILKFHNDFNRWSSIIGANPGAYGTAGAAWSIIKKGISSGNLAVLIASIALVGIHEFSYREMQKYTAEQERRG